MDAVDRIAVGEPPAEPTKIVRASLGDAARRRRVPMRRLDSGSGCAELAPAPRSRRPAADARRPFRLRASRRPNCAAARPAARFGAAAAGRRARRFPTTQVLDLPSLLRPGDVLVFNDTKVIPAQLEGRRGEARIGATLHKREGPRSWWAFVRNARRLHVGDRVEFGEGVAASAVERGRGRRVPAPIPRRRAGRAAARARRADAAAAVHRLAPAGRRGRPRRLPDHVRAGGRRGRGADRGAALHAAAARGAGGARDRPRDADPARRRGDVPAGQGGHRRRAPDARRMGADRRRDRRAAERRRGRTAGG